MKKNLNIAIIILSIFTFFSCASTELEDVNLTINDCNGSIFDINGTENCDHLKVIFDGVMPDNIPENFYCLVNNKKYLITQYEYLPYSEGLINSVNQFTLYSDNKKYWYPTSDDYVDLKENNINSVTLCCTKKIKYESLQVVYKFHDCRIIFKNAEYLRPSDETVLSKCGVNITGKEITGISYKQIQNLLTDDTSNFFSDYLGRKTALQWKSFWDSEEGKDYYNLFIETKNRILNERISSYIDLSIGEYDIEKQSFPCKYKDNGYFTIKNASNKVFDNIHLDEKNALTIENLKGGWSNKFSTKINYYVVGFKDNKIEITDVRLDFVDNDGTIICSSQLTVDNQNTAAVADTEKNDTKSNINKDENNEYFNFKNMHGQTVVDIFENSIFDVFDKELASYDTDLKKKVFLESNESDKYKKAQASAKKTIMENGIETIVLDYCYAISNFDTKTNMFYIHVGSKYKDSNYTGPDKCIENFYYDKLPTKVVGGEYCLTWPVNNQSKALEIENEKKNIAIKLVTKVNAIKKISYDWYTLNYEMDSNFKVTVTEKYDSTWSTKVLNCTSMKVIVYNKKTNEIYKTYEF